MHKHSENIVSPATMLVKTQ